MRVRIPKGVFSSAGRVSRSGRCYPSTCLVISHVGYLEDREVYGFLFFFFLGGGGVCSFRSISGCC